MKSARTLFLSLLCLCAPALFAANAAAPLAPATAPLAPATSPEPVRTPADAYPAGPEAGILFELPAALTTDGTKHSVNVRYLDVAANVLVEQRFGLTMTGKQPQPLLTLLRDPEAQTKVRSTPGAALEVTIDGKACGRQSFANVLAADAALRLRVDVAKEIRSFGTRGNVAHGKLLVRPNTTFSCPESDWQGCWDTFDQCDLYCDQQDPYNLCTDCAVRRDECLNGVLHRIWSEETITSTTFPSLPVCDVNNGVDLYHARIQHIHHEDYEEYFCVGSGYYTVFAGAYNYDVTCYHFYVFAPSGCASFGYVDVDCTY